jgi:hypothetical protein
MLFGAVTFTRVVLVAAITLLVLLVLLPAGAL